MKSIGMYDGKIINLDESVVKLEDRGYQYGDGIYDAWALFNGRHMLLKEHLDRFERNCSMISIKPSFSRKELEQIVDNMVNEAGISEAMVYLQYTRGWISPRNHVNDPKGKPTLSGSVFPLKPYPQEYLTCGTRNISYPDRRHFYCNIKTINLLGNILAKNAAFEKGCYEAIFIRELKDRQVVTECTHSNCFAVKDGVIYTAPKGNLILPGITRDAVINLARAKGISVMEEYNTLDFYLNADEAFITSSLVMVPISHIDDRPIGDGKVGPVVKNIMELYQNLIYEVCYK